MQIMTIILFLISLLQTKIIRHFSILSSPKTLILKRHSINLELLDVPRENVLWFEWLMCGQMEGILQ